ncbi:helix-turn-helix domain-containing protein [Sphingomonas sp. CARO-RG-8B-R24-01]|uniref:winged helix-turn-helix transcriptional regulator n=1 Tax=Sphingomonas sp. CARO-RG-8B-R24-01 TaxID=2914831 RepID=UPI001F55CA4F|nr:helix-turn-helix domain-containing protein [Sphingomonas sp. CARO-RG-8B-R24-01]
MKLEKITTERWYDDACGTALALEFLGERWALLIVRELLLGPRRFGEIRSGLPGVSANVLTQRLQTLEAAGVLTRETTPPPAHVQAYALTPWGREAEPIVMALGRWALRSPAHDPSLPFSPVSLMLALRMMLLPERTRGFDATIGFRMGKDAYCARVVNGMVLIERGALDRAGAVLSGEPNAFLPALFGTTPLPDVIAKGRLDVTGDVALATRFCTFFELPPKIGCN